MLAKVGWAQRTSSGPFNADALSSAGAATKTPSAAAGAKGKASASQHGRACGEHQGPEAPQAPLLGT